MRVVLIFIFIFLFTFLNLKACECKRISFKAECDYADIIFHGSITKKIDSVSTGRFYYTFAISKVWKGHEERTIVVSSWNNPAACGINLEIGKDYIIYSKAGEISQCSRNELFSQGYSLPLLNYKYDPSDATKFGTDKAETLNSFETNYLSSVLGIGNYAATPYYYRTLLKNSKVAYLINDTLLSKEQFFSFNKKYEPTVYFYEFEKDQVRRSGGYTGIIYLEKKKKFSKKSLSKKIEKLKAKT